MSVTVSQLTKFTITLVLSKSMPISQYWRVHPVKSENSATIAALGDIQRAPSFFYHYVMSFPLKIIRLFTDDVMMQVMALRLINVMFIAGSMLVIYKTIKLVYRSELIARISLLALTFVGMFTWVAASINYDNLAFLLFWFMIYWALMALQKYSPTKLALAVSTSLLLIITKITYAPIIVIFWSAMLIIYWRTLKKSYFINGFQKIHDYQFKKEHTYLYSYVPLSYLFSV